VSAAPTDTRGSAAAAPGTAEERAELRAGAAALGVPLDERQLSQQLQLLDALADWARRFNLTAIRARERMLTLHTLDSLSAASALQGARIADAGTGAGFPGLPLAIAFPQLQFTLIDGTAKKLRFVSEMVQQLGLINVQVVHARAEALPRTGARFDTVLARALASLAEIVALTGQLLAPGGCLVALKGKLPEAELAALPAGWRAAEVRRLQVPGLDAERHLVVLRRSGGGPGRDTDRLAHT
jgi:16S rRNA (guanine527-N7)-methyltransferase